jgi:hypothetical protein
MSWVRVAVASTDGTVIDQSLQEVSSFRIYDVAPEGPSFVELRSSEVASDCGTSGEPSSGLAFDEFIDLISDCSILIVQSLGVDAGGKMQIGWITVYEAEMSVDKALQKLSRSPLFRQALGVNHPYSEQREVTIRIEER